VTAASGDYAIISFLLGLCVFSVLVDNFFVDLR